MTLPQQQPASQPQSQHFLLKWNNHRSNMVSVFESLLQSENLVDVTLAVEGKFLKGHKIVLSACSPYFESMFVNQTPGEKHPILIFHDMKFSHLKTLLDFMYRGEISIDEKDLSDVLKVAEALSIRGLSSFESDDEDSSEKSCEQNGNDPPAQNTTSTNTNVNSGAPPAPGFGFNSNGASTNNNDSNNQSPNQSDNQSNSGNMNCDSSVNGSVSSKNQSKGSASVRGQKKGSFLSTSPSPVQSPAQGASTTVKRRRGRQTIRKDAVSASPSRASPYKQPHIDRNVKPLSNRQRVRRRMPRQFSIPTPAINPARVKVEKHSDTEETAMGGVSGATSPEDDEMDTADFMVPDMDGASGILPPDICNSEPLSEMSVRGLDLFKYASIEDGVYRCIECEKLCIPKTFKNKYSFQRHAFLYHEGNMRKVFPCPVCSREFSRPDKMKNHLRSIHEGGKGVRHNNGPGISDPQSSNTGDSNDFKLDKCDV
ncbi:unnamed protein product [Allacma fusca]|uniref:Uncharacterized protein n=1 Tax=Allacma fusca TaxID=39272 RepID=A0A8J2JY09_9HEXA|nr:unnamed protein product [Allacma fusca]